MTLQELRFIIALAREKHFRRAADACFVSQPTLSIAIQKLEKELGVTLFERDTNEIRITKIGEEIVERAKRIMCDVAEIKEIAANNEDNASLKLGAIYTIGPYVFPALIHSLQAISAMPIEIHEDYTVNLRKKLLNGELDAIIISLPLRGAGLVTKVLYEESFVVLMPKNHPLARCKTIDDKALSAHHILMLGEGHCFREQIMSACRACFTKSKNYHTVDNASLETIRHMVASGMGLTILPERASKISAYENMLITRPLQGKMQHRTVALAYRQSFPRVKALETLKQALKQL
jgi:LysR family hydrogen peroxide-inducible transcriptional activator